MKWKFICAVAMLCGQLAAAQSWLSLPFATGYVDIGDLDISGTALTIEALYTSTDPGSVDLVSKHSDPSNVNYLLRRTHAELTTTGGFFSTPQVCTPDENTCRHAAMVYDGATLSFYLNGQLNGQVAQTGVLVNNNFQTLIGNYGCCFAGEQFIGFIDEVRLWNVARSQADIQNFMFAPLPAPTTQPGLLAYYQFSSTLNLQGDPTWDGILGGTASIGATNPFCGALSPVCAILSSGFARFIYQVEPDGLAFDWTWTGEAPQAFEFRAGPKADRLALVARLQAGEAIYHWTGIPAAETWFQVVAIDANGRRTASNVVAYHPQVKHLVVTQAADQVRIQGPAGAVDWQLIDGLGRVLRAGSLPGFDGWAEVALPDGVRGAITLIARNAQERAQVRVLRLE
jgi:hypothetical protein